MDQVRHYLTAPIPQAYVPITQQRKHFKPAPPFPVTVPALNEETAHVRHFLAACSPSMIQFLLNFIAIGCKNEDFLLAVASWPDDMIELFLKSVSSCEGSEFTGMDIFVLKNHFRNHSA